MLFVSRATHFSVGIRSTVDLQTHNNTGVPVRQGLIVDFRPGGIPEWAKQQAAEVFGHQPGLAHDEDPTWRYSMLDTNAEAFIRGWDDATRAEVEDKLLRNPNNGNDYVLVDKPRLKPPWPNYDQLVPRGKRTMENVAQQIASKVHADGYDRDYVIAYESENQNRREVIVALQAEVVEPEEDLIEA